MQLLSHIEHVSYDFITFYLYSLKIAILETMLLIISTPPSSNGSCPPTHPKSHFQPYNPMALVFPTCPWMCFHHLGHRVHISGYPPKEN